MNKEQLSFASLRSVILFIYDFKCSWCKFQSISNHVHHIDNNHSNNDAFNLVPLCKLCHISAHRLNILFIVKPNENQKDELKKLNFYT